MSESPTLRGRAALKKWLQFRKRVPHDEVVDAAQHVHYGFKFHAGHVLVERYLQGGYDVHVHCLARVHGADRESRDWHVCLRHRDHAVRFDCPRPEPNVSAGVRDYPDAMRRSDDGMQESVFVDSVEVVKDPEGMRCECRASVVRLQPLDFCLRRRVYASNLATTVVPEQASADAGLTLPIGVSKDRNSEPSAMSGGSGRPVCLHANS